MSTHTPVTEALRGAITAFLADKGIEPISVSFERSNTAVHGDLTTNCAFALSKALKRSPREVADEIAAYLNDAQINGVATVSAAAPGFINISLSPAFFAEMLTKIEEEKTGYGSTHDLNGQVWAIEHTSPNPNKAMHLGHLRNNLVGMTVGRLLEASGASVIYEAVDNNRGIAIAKAMWGFLAHRKKNTEAPTDVAYWRAHKEEWETPETLNMLPDVFVSECYVMGDTDAKDPAIEEHIRNMVVGWEAKDEALWDLWRHILAYSYAGMERTLGRLQNRWDKVWHEHEHYEKGKAYVEEGLARGVFTKLEDGAVLTNLASYSIPDTILLKRDGTSLYITQDIALTALKKETHHADKLLWVVGPDQTLALRQLFAVCEQLGIGKVSDFTHIPYGYVGLKAKDGGFEKMSSREGTVVLIDEVIDSVRDSLLENGETASSALAESLALCAVKFSILKSDRTQDLTFDVERSIETKGDSGIYVMYTYVRARSILRKAGEGPFAGDPASVSEAGNAVLRALLHFPQVVVRGREDLSGHHIAQYLLEVAGLFNAWYAHEVILDGSPYEAARLRVVAATATVLQNGFRLLGIQTVEEM